MYTIKIKGNTGYKGKRLTDENVNRFPQRILDLWEKSGIIKKSETKVKTQKKE